MLKPAAIIFGIFFLVAGIGGFFPALAPHGMLFGIFMVGPVHNSIHIASGAAALLCAFAGAGAARKYFQIFGVVYLLVALLGFVYGNEPLMGWWNTTRPTSDCTSPSPPSRSSWVSRATAITERPPDFCGSLRPGSPRTSQR